MKKTIIIIVVAAVIVSAFIFFVIAPLMANMKKNSNDLLSAKKTYSALQEQIDNLEQFKATRQMLEYDRAKADNLFVDPDMPLRFVQLLEDIADVSQITISISPAGSKAIKGDTWPSMAFRISAAGSTVGCFKFLERLETAPALLEIQNLSISAISEEEALRRKQLGLPTGEVEAEFLIKVYSIKQPR
ncbi:MAG: hypothetical protein AAB620_02330 [Patescibacteria group bacterium]